MKILIVEDELKTGDYLRQGLTEAGFTVDLTRDGADGLHQAISEDYDLMILDVMLPKLNGWQVLEMFYQGALCGARYHYSGTPKQNYHCGG